MKFFEKSFKKIICAIVLCISLSACGKDDRLDLLKFPSIVLVDQDSQQIFVIDDRDNRINVVDAITHVAATGGDKNNEALLNDEDAQLLPLNSTNAALASLGLGNSRLFVIGANGAPSQEIIVLDYISSEAAFSAASISPIAVPSASAQDVLVGVALDSITSRLFVTNSGTGNLHIFNSETGAEDAASPIALAGTPTQLSIDAASRLLAVADASATTVSFIDLDDSSAVPLALDLGYTTRDIALATTAQGTVLFNISLEENRAQAHLLDLANLAASTLIWDLTAPLATDPAPNPELITGSLNRLLAGVLTDGRMGAFLTQSTGDLLVLELDETLSAVTPTLVAIEAASGEDLAVLENASSQITELYFASPGVGVLSLVDPLAQTLLDQIP